MAGIKREAAFTDEGIHTNIRSARRIKVEHDAAAGPAPKSYDFNDCRPNNLPEGIVKLYASWDKQTWGVDNEDKSHIEEDKETQSSEAPKRYELRSGIQSDRSIAHPTSVAARVAKRKIRIGSGNQATDRQKDNGGITMNFGRPKPCTKLGHGHKEDSKKASEQANKNFMDLTSDMRSPYAAAPGELGLSITNNSAGPTKRNDDTELYRRTQGDRTSEDAKIENAKLSQRAQELERDIKRKDRLVEFLLNSQASLRNRLKDAHEEVSKLKEKCSGKDKRHELKVHEQGLSRKFAVLSAGTVKRNVKVKEEKH